MTYVVIFLAQTRSTMGDKCTSTSSISKNLSRSTSALRFHVRMINSKQELIRRDQLDNMNPKVARQTKLKLLLHVTSN